MDKIVENVLMSYGLSKLEIQNVLNIAPMMEFVTGEELYVNCQLLVTYGYPESELDYLFMANPNIFVKSSNDLKEELEDLLKKYDDLEIVLKENPNII